MEELWDIARVAGYLGVSERTVYNRVRSGELPAIKVGRLWRVRESALRAYLGEMPAPLSAETAALAAPGIGARPPATGAYSPPTTAYPDAAGGAAIAAEPGAIPERAELEALLAGVTDVVVRRLLFVALLSKGVVALGWRAPVIVGGYAVQYYTAGDYATADVDLAGSSEPVAEVLGAWGFERLGRHWYDDALNLVVEVPGGELEPGETEHRVTVTAAGLAANVLGIEDLIIDRLAACVFWNDVESCMWATALLKVAIDLDEQYLDSRAAEADVAEKLAEIRKAAE